MAEACSALSGAFRQDLLVSEHRAELEALLKESIVSHKVWIWVGAVDMGGMYGPPDGRVEAIWGDN